LYIKKTDQTDGRKRNKIATPYLEEGNPRCRVLLSSCSTTKKIIMNQITKYYIKRKLEKELDNVEERP
jgi:hypothetical protein